MVETWWFALLCFAELKLSIDVAVSVKKWGAGYLSMINSLQAGRLQLYIRSPVAQTPKKRMIKKYIQRVSNAPPTFLGCETSWTNRFLRHRKSSHVIRSPHRELMHVSYARFSIGKPRIGLISHGL